MQLEHWKRLFLWRVLCWQLAKIDMDRVGSCHHGTALHVYLYSRIGNLKTTFVLTYWIYEAGLHCQIIGTSRPKILNSQGAKGLAQPPSSGYTQVMLVCCTTDWASSPPLECKGSWWAIGRRGEKFHTILHSVLPVKGAWHMDTCLGSMALG